MAESCMNGQELVPRVGHGRQTKYGWQPRVRSLCVIKRMSILLDYDTGTICHPNSRRRRRQTLGN
jgi:hypothetical protein